MMHLTGIYLTDDVTKDGTQFSIGAMNDMVWQSSDGGVPSHMSHDMQKLVGWSRAKGLYISPNRCSVLGDTMIPESSDEWKYIQDCQNKFITKIISDGVSKCQDAFNIELEKSRLIDKNGLWHYNGVVQYIYDGVVEKAFPNLHAKIDDAGLLSLNDILKDFDYLGQGVFGHKKSKLGILLHPYFRRSLSELNNYNFGLLDLLFNVYNAGNKSVRVRIATNVVVYSPSWVQSGEYDYWFGPKYNDDISSIREGCTRHTSSDEDKTFNNVEFTDFIWQKKDGEYQFEVEEVVNIESLALSKGIIGCKYMHSFFNFQQGSFRHFDGAIREYDRDLMKERLNIPIDQMGHKAQYKKLFRMDGEIPLHTWKSIVTQFMYGNPLIYEYFNAEIPCNEKTSQEQSATEKPISKYIPYLINKGDGVRLMVSYHPYVNETAIRRFATLDEITTSSGKIECMEFAALEIKKVLHRLGSEIEMPQSFKYVVSNDSYNNVPIISHGDNCVDVNVNRTLDAIRLLIGQHVTNGDEYIYSFSLSWNMNGKNVCLSFIGHVIDLNQWLNSFSHLPVTSEEFRTWVEIQAKFVKEHGCNSPSYVNDKLARNDGVLYLQHRCMQRDADIKNIQIKDGCMVAEVKVNVENEDLKELLNTSSLTFVPIVLIHDTICEDTGNSYIDDNRSSVFGEVTYEIDEASTMEGLVWTDKPNFCLPTVVKVRNS